MLEELFDEGLESDLRASAELLEQCADLVRASMSIDDAKTFLLSACSSIGKKLRGNNTTLYEALGTSLSTVLKDLPNLQDTKRKMHQIKQAKAFMAEYQSEENTDFKKSKIIEKEQLAIEILLEGKVGYKGVLAYLQKRYGKQMEEKGITAFSRQEVQRKIAQIKQMRSASQNSETHEGNPP